MIHLWVSLSLLLFLDTPDSQSPTNVPALCLTLRQSLDITYLAQDQWGSEWEGVAQGSARGHLPPDLGQILCQVRDQQGHGTWTALLFRHLIHVPPLNLVLLLHQPLLPSEPSR